MNVEDRLRFARYYPGYVEPPEELESDSDKTEQTENNANASNTDENKKTILGYIEKIDIDKDKLINDTIQKNS